ncbi:uncharacterized protein LOC104895780 isoform X2 [Beta vulgaris subsp. vulgaris]|uniref:uncharacterized protein LOC104895780 isoform X2 n=1 Tax=Beta vulgaris subsp. vulgaris TaxID=3555 RepID=UPI002037134F|nr:uncharacterized protein LOC104895780 isoform X2 [Beta vulgaris subsp. vulgaris]
MLNKRSEEGIRGRAEAENMSLTYTRSHWAFYGRCLYSCSQVWFHVNEQLPVGSQKSLPDQAPYMCETALDVSEGVSRDEETLQPTVYLNKLPEKFPEGARIFVVDPMLATDFLEDV